ncbi:MAG: Gfo/Idh/MocA family oxidoreductase [Paracoccaceae bacterium]|nr:Gfo/Idh/MocA family oxidoreductase [Paracoccaceae bacterium]
MSKPVRWGILGGSNFAADKMGPAIHAAKGAVLAGLATSSAEKARRFQAFAPDLEVFDSYEALLAAPGIEAVYIPLPNHLHVEWTLKAVAAGKHVLVEKPLALRADDFDPVIEARDRSGLLVAEAFMIAHHPQFHRARALVGGGAIGELRLVDAVFSYDNRDSGNIRNRPETGGGSLPDIGVYTFGSARLVTGEEPERVGAHIERENGVDVFAHVTADFPSFRFSSITSMRMHPRQEITFHGTEGVLRLTCPWNAGVFSQAELELHRNVHSGDTPASVTVERWPRVNHYVLQVESFGASLRDGAIYPCSLEFSRGTQAMIDRVWAAEKRDG